MGERLGARGKSRGFDKKSLPLASGLAPLAQTVTIAAEALMSNTGYARFFGSLNMKYITTTTVDQNNTCLCQKRTSP